MIYPYTIVLRKDVESIINILAIFGYASTINIQKWLINNPNIQNIYIVINDMNFFGNYCLYSKDSISPDIYRDYIENLNKFLKLAAKYKNYKEY